MTIIKKTGIAFSISVALLTAWVATASVGDAIYIQRHIGPATKLSPASKTAIGQAVLGVWPSIPLADFDGERCSLVLDTDTDYFECIAWQEVTITDAEYLDLDLAGELENPNQTTIKKLMSKEVLNATQVEAHSNFTETAFGLELEQVAWYQCRRDASAKAVVWCKYHQVVTASPADYRADRTAGNVLRLIGKAAE